MLAILALVPALALAQGQPVKAQQDGVQLGLGWWGTINCVTPVTCERAPATGVLSITSSGGGGGGAPTNATYITQTANASLSNEQALSSLSTGIVKVTTGTGVLSTAASGTDYAPATSGSAVQLGNGSGGFSAYAGTSCTNQFPRSLSTAGAATCASVNLASDVTGTLASSSLPTVPVTKGGTNLTTVAANQVMTGTAADTLVAKTLPSCSGASSALTFNNATQTWGCNTITGGSNTASDAITFAGNSDATRTVTAAWASGSSVIVCHAADEEGSVEGLQVTVTARASGSFTVRGYVLQGTHTGALNIFCTGG